MGYNCLTKPTWCHDFLSFERFRWEHWVVSLLTLPEKHGLLLFNMSTLLRSEWLYQILTTQCRCWQAPRPSACCCQEPPWNSSQGLFVQLFCLLRPFGAVKMAEGDVRGNRVSEWWKEKTDRDSEMMHRVRRRSTWREKNGKNTRTYYFAFC